MARYTTVNIMKINACNATIKMWNIDQPAPKIAPKIVPVTPVAAHRPINKNITSPAYILPNSRNEWESGFEIYSIRLKAKFATNNNGLNIRPIAPPMLFGIAKLGEPNGAQNNSWIQPPNPLTLIEN